MKRSTTILLALFAILGSVSAWYIMTKGSITSLKGTDYDFAIKDTTKIGKIFMVDRKGQSVTLEHKGKDWIVNGKYKARPNTLRNLVIGMAKVDLLYRVPRNTVPTIIKDIASEGIKVEVYDNGGSLMKAYYVGGVTPDEKGTFMIMEGSNEPYVTYMPGFEGGLRVRYVTREMDWRDKTIFAEQLENIKAVSVEYPRQKNKSFRLMKTDKGYDITPFYSITPKTNLPYRQGSAEAYLMGFEKQIAEAFENENPSKDSIRTLEPFSIVSLTTLNGETRTVKLFPIVTMDKDGYPVKNDQGDIAMERYFADCSTGDFMLVQDRLWSKVLRPYEFFFAKR